MQATREAFRLLVRWTVLVLLLLLSLLFGFYAFLRPLAAMYNAFRPQPPVMQSPMSPSPSPFPSPSSSSQSEMQP